MKILDIRSVDRLERAINQGSCIVSCGAPWFLTCRNQYSILTRIAENCSGWDAIVHVDIEKCPDAESILAIQSIPTIVFYGNGEETARFVGLKSLEDLQEVLETICPSQLTDQPAATTTIRGCNQSIL
jgi:thioredoxin-like negative regulator of GroEL